jgi:hypothetical protein
MSTASKPRPLFPLAYNIPKGHVKHSRFLYPMLRKLRLSYHAVLQRGLQQWRILTLKMPASPKSAMDQWQLHQVVGSYMLIKYDKGKSIKRYHGHLW